jgi:hypothetical protein
MSTCSSLLRFSLFFTFPHWCMSLPVPFLLFYSLIFRHISLSSCIPFVLRSFSSSCLCELRWPFPAPALLSDFSISSLPSILSSSRAAFFHVFLCCYVYLPTPSFALWAHMLLFCSFFCHPTLLCELHFLLRYSVIVPRCCVSSTCSISLSPLFPARFYELTCTLPTPLFSDLPRTVPYLLHYSLIFPHCSMSWHAPYLLRYSLIFPHCSMSLHVPYLLRYSLILPHCCVSSHVPCLLQYSSIVQHCSRSSRACCLPRFSLFFPHCRISPRFFSPTLFPHLPISMRADAFFAVLFFPHCCMSSRITPPPFSLNFLHYCLSLCVCRSCSAFSSVLFIVSNSKMVTMPLWVYCFTVVLLSLCEWIVNSSFLLRHSTVWPAGWLLRVT